MNLSFVLQWRSKVPIIKMAARRYFRKRGETRATGAENVAVAAAQCLSRKSIIAKPRSSAEKQLREAAPRSSAEKQRRKVETAAR